MAVVHIDSSEISGRILVPWSGGLDSTWLIWHLLENTDCKVLAHHCVLYRWIPGRGSRRVRAELTAVNRMRPVFDRHDRFTFAQTEMNFGRSYRLQTTMHNVLVHSAQVAAHLTIEDRAFAYISLGLNTRAEWPHDPQHDHEWGGKFDKIIKLFSTWDEHGTPPDLAVVHPIPSRKKQVETLPRHLLEMTMSCYLPREDLSRCGECDKCQEINPIVPGWTWSTPSQPRLSPPTLILPPGETA